MNFLDNNEQFDNTEDILFIFDKKQDVSSKNEKQSSDDDETSYIPLSKLSKMSNDEVFTENFESFFNDFVLFNGNDDDDNSDIDGKSYFENNFPTITAISLIDDLEDKNSKLMLEKLQNATDEFNQYFAIDYSRIYEYLYDVADYLETNYNLLNDYIYSSFARPPNTNSMYVYFNENRYEYANIDNLEETGILADLWDDKMIITNNPLLKIVIEMLYSKHQSVPHIVQEAILNYYSWCSMIASEYCIQIKEITNDLSIRFEPVFLEKFQINNTVLLYCLGNPSQIYKINKYSNDFIE